ncbi:MAG: CYTH domain-containing protein [Thermoleophilia bacterium]|nr:CYTH domain-containing protein [Thermoleophilia bacterium]
MGTEIERKFLLTEAPGWLGECPSRHIAQGYLALEADVEVRLRRLGDEFRLTVKSGHGLSRGETEIELDRGQFEALWPMTGGRRILKRRYYRPAEEGTFEIDVFESELVGLLTVEMEYDSEAASETFDPPAWLGDEVTGDDRYANRSLATRGFPQLGKEA